MSDYYEILGVGKDATKDEIKSAFNIFSNNESTSEETKKIDFGMGPSIPYTAGYVNEGIMVW